MRAGPKDLSLSDAWLRCTPVAPRLPSNNPFKSHPRNPHPHPRVFPGSSNVHVSNVSISNGDDCITIKSGSHDIVVEDVDCHYSHGIAVGSVWYAETAVSRRHPAASFQVVQSNCVMRLLSRET